MEERGISVSDQDQNQLDDVRKRVKEIQRARRSGIRWRITKHTAEMTMRALEGSEARPPHKPSTKSRRRKRHKRLL
jgi:hypothetical protein